MKAAWYERNGGAAEVLQFGERPLPEPGQGEVRVRLAFSGVNPSDVKSRAGSRPVRDPYIIPHSDGSGVIDKVGAGVDAARAGERVWTWNAQYQRPLGTAAQYIVLPQDQAIRLPDAASMEDGACLGIPALTAWHAVESADLGPGNTVLVIAASSGVGYYAAQMARDRGAHVICTAGSPERAALLRDAGFDDIIFYKQESVADRVLQLTAGAGVNAIIDMDFSTSAALVDQGVLAGHGRFVCYGSNDRGNVQVNFAAWMPRSITLVFFLVYELTAAQRRRALDGLHELLSRNALRHQIGQRFSLADIVAAHEAVEAGSVGGRVLVDCS